MRIESGERRILGNMKVNRIKSCCIVGIMALLFSVSPTESSIKDITKPYLGEYECQSARLGELEYLDGFKEIVLELKQNGKFVVRYQTKSGRRGEVDGKYEYDAKRKEITFLKEDGYKKSFALSKGEFTLSFPVNGQIMKIQFKQK